MKLTTAILFPFALLIASAPAQNPAAPDHPLYGTYSFSFENDIVSEKDQYYSNGLRYGWTSPSLRKFSEQSTLGRFGHWLDTVPWLGLDEYERNVAFILGQAIYTPANINTAALLPDDRPYAGYLYTGLGLIWKNDRVRNTIVLNAGVVGPWSLAEETQNLVHELTDSTQAQGWHNQLKNEPVVSLAYERMWRLRPVTRDTGWDWQAFPYAGFTVGNLAINGRAGTEFRFGYNLPDSFGMGAIDPASTTSSPLEGFRSKQWRHRFGAHLFVRGEARAVAHDIFLDGNTWRDSHSVEREPFVFDLSAGFSLNWKNTSMTYSLVHRSREFEKQEEDQIFGSVTFNWTF